MTVRSLMVLVSALALAACGTGDTEGLLVASGTIEATEADLAFALPGKILALTVREGDRVEKGQALGELEHAELEARRTAALAQVDGAQAMLAELRAGFRSQEVAQARLAVVAADQRYDEQARETARTVRLAEGGAVSQESRERAETALSLVAAERSRLAEQLALLEDGSRAERVRGQRAQVAQAEAMVSQLDALRDQQELTAPFAGIITLRHREPGEVVAGGMPVLRVLDPVDRWVRIYVRQDQVGRLSLGQHATIVSDGFPDLQFEGEVSVIAAEAEFTPRNVQTKAERVKLVHAVRIRILGDEGLTLKPGLAADVTLDITPR